MSDHPDDAPDPEDLAAERAMRQMSVRPAATVTNRSAVHSMVWSIVGLCIGCWPFIGPGSAIRGHRALREIRRTGEQGRGLAIAGIVIGWGQTALFVLLFLPVLILSLVAYLSE